MKQTPNQFTIIKLITIIFKFIYIFFWRNLPTQERKINSNECLTVNKNLLVLKTLIISPISSVRTALFFSAVFSGTLRARLVCVFKNWKLLFKNIYGNTCGWKSVLKCCLKTENGCLKTQTKHPLYSLKFY